MPLLAQQKRRLSALTASAALRADAVESALCGYLSIIALAGLVANAFAGITWADPVAALCLIPLVAREGLPIADEEIDVAMVNGIFNLNPARDAIFRELARVVRHGGTVFAAELILSSPLPPEGRASETTWFA